MPSNYDIITKFHLPLMEEAYNPEDAFNFPGLPKIVQHRFFELASTSRLVNVKQTNSEYLKLAEKLYGEYPVDRFELRELHHSSPIKFNQFRRNNVNDRVEWIANPTRDTYDPFFLNELNILKEVAFTNVSIRAIHEVLDHINWSKASSLEIRCDISWEALKRLKTDKLKKFLLDGEVIGLPGFKDFLGFLDGMEDIYVEIPMNLPLNEDIIFEEWKCNQGKLKKLRIYVKQQTSS